MNKAETVDEIRAKLRAGEASVGSWMQINSSAVAEIMGAAGYDWVAVDLEHGVQDPGVLPDVFRALELGNTLPLVRVTKGTEQNCKLALDAGAAGVIVPMVESAEQLLEISRLCRWPPSGVRGVGFSRANLFGQNFVSYSKTEAQAPLLVAMIEHIRAVENLDAILAVPGLDAIFIGPYDLSASMGMVGQFGSQAFLDVLARIGEAAEGAGVPNGIHVVAPSPEELQLRVAEGYQFIAYSIDAVLLRLAAEAPGFETAA